MSSAEQDARRSEIDSELYRTFVRQSLDGVIIVDGSGTVLEWNQGEERITGIAADDALGRPIWELQYRLAPDERRSDAFLQTAREKCLRGLAEGGSLVRVLEEEIQRPDGTRRVIESIVLGLARGSAVFGGAICRDVTTRRRLEDDLRASEERLALAISASGQGLWDWDLAADQAYLSPEYQRLSGYSGARVHPALAFFRDIVHPDDLPDVLSRLDDHLRGQSDRSVIEYRMRTASGDYAWIHGIGQVTARGEGGVPLRMSGVIEDISARRRLEDDLRAQQALLLEAERLAHVGHWTYDLASGAQSWSDEVYRILGLEPQTVSASQEAFLRAVAMEDRDRIAECLHDTVRDGIPRSAEYRIVDTRGRTHTVSGTVALFRDRSGAPFRLIGTLQDISERKMIEEKMADANRRKDEFLALLSHELRNPLSALEGGVYVLARSDPRGEQAQRMQAVLMRQVTHLTRLVDDLLDVNRVSRGTLRLQRERVELGELVRAAGDDHHPAFSVAAIELEITVVPQPVWVVGDATRLTQAIGNLLANAVKFTPAGGRTELSLDVDGPVAVVRVRDTGIGIAPEVVDRLFEPFVQADRGLHRARGGLGLGLALVKGLAGLHGGSVAATSAGPGAGAEFVLRLPLEPGGAPAPAAEPSRETAPRAARRVLVVEDNADLALSIRYILELHGHQVQVAHTGPEGLARARAFQPEVVICDIGLPGTDGYEVARALRADRALAGARLIALTGYAFIGDLARARDAGFHHHLAKPPDFERLLDLVGEGPASALI